MDLDADYKRQEARIAKLPKRKQERSHEALKVEHKRLALQAQVRACEQEFMAITKGFSQTERMLIDRHALLENLINDDKEQNR